MQSKELQTLLDNLAQPAFAAKDGAVALCNRAAADRMLRVGDSLDVLTVADGVISLCGTEYDAAVQQIGDFSVYFLSAPEEQSSLSAAAFHAAQSLREPLSSLFSTFSELFPVLEELENDELQEGLSHINRSFFRMMHLACNLSDLYTARSGQMPLYYQRVEFCDFVYDLFLKTESLCRVCGVELNVSLPPQTFFLWIDAQKIERLVLNLLSNALRFSSAGGTISLLLSKTDRFAVLSVTDSGEGVAPEVLADLYNRYERPLDAEDARYGFGAGLTLCRKIAELHGGSLMLSPEAPHGTRAVLRLPLAKPRPEQLTQSPLAMVDYTGGLPHALVEFADVLPSSVFSTENIN